MEPLECPVEHLWEGPVWAAWDAWQLKPSRVFSQTLRGTSGRLSSQASSWAVPKGRTGEGGEPSDQNQSSSAVSSLWMWEVIVPLNSHMLLQIQAAGEGELTLSSAWHIRGANLDPCSCPRCAGSCLKSGPQPFWEHRARIHCTCPGEMARLGKHGSGSF